MEAVPKYKVCKQCGVNFFQGKIHLKDYLRRKYCSQRCSTDANIGKVPRRPDGWKDNVAKARRNRVPVTKNKECLGCGEIFSRKVRFAHKRWELQQYCSQKCSHIALHDDVTKDKIRLSKMGVRNPMWKDGRSVGINKGLFRTYLNRKRKSEKKKNGGTHSFQQWEDLKKFYNYMCLCCKQQEPFIKLTEDHIRPVSIGGSNDISNIQPLCGSCNSIKWAKIIDYRIISNITP